MSPFTGKMEILFCGKVYFKTKNLSFRFFPQQGNSSGKKNLRRLFSFFCAQRRRGAKKAYLRDYLFFLFVRRGGQDAKRNGGRPP